MPERVGLGTLGKYVASSCIGRQKIDILNKWALPQWDKCNHPQTALSFLACRQLEYM